MRKNKINRAYKRFRVVGMLPGEHKITVLGVKECETDAKAVVNEYKEVFPEGDFDIEYGYFADYLDINELVRREIVYKKIGILLGSLKAPMGNVIRSLAKC